MIDSHIQSKVLSGNVNIGIPLSQDGIDPCSISTQVATSVNGLLAFVVGLSLGGLTWAIAQGSIILSLILLGPAVTWEHVLFITISFMTIMIGVWRIIKQCFSTTDDNETNVPSYEIDICNAMQDLSLLGCVISNLILHILVAESLYKLSDFHLNFENSTGAEIVAIAVLLVWGLSTKIRDYNRAVRRAGIESEDLLVHAWIA